MPDFVQLHNHTEFSLLDGAAKISDMTAKAAKCEMSHVAITDHGNMFGVPKFVLAAKKQGVKPIVGCEFYIITGDARERDKTKKRHHQIMWAKDKTGYHNLVKLCSFGYTDGYYYKPRIDKEILKQHTEGVIASTCCLASEVNQTLIKHGEDAAEEVLKEYIDLFGKENYYVEIQRHTLGDMEKCNEWLLRMAKKHALKVIATNDVHYVNEEDSEAHDLLLALQTQSDYNDPNRFRFTDDKGRLNPRFYFKDKGEMLELFQDVPHALDQTVELAERCTFEMSLTGDMILPQYKVPSQYKDMDDYLKAMVWERAPKRYPEITSVIEERVAHELKIIKRMGYAGYFLIVQSFTTEARNRGVYVGPGRGSAAGSVVAYILGIIDIDPLTYDLLFERFLNPERVSPPDIDIDFDDEGRQEVIDYVIGEYGRESVSQVITYGTMGAKTALRDVGRTLGIPLSEVNRIAKMIPDKPGMSFKKSLDANQNPDHAEELKALFSSPDPLINKMMRFAKTLEGTARHTGVHACAVIIAPDAITNYVPVSKAKDDAIVTQYDGPMSEMCGLLKMDFLGLKTLSIIKTAIKLAKENRGVEMHPDDIPLDDELTYELYQRGDTVATFQFESDGMRKYLRQLKPTNIEDLIAMNALYRPGPMDNIPSFVRRKHGEEPIVYPHDMLEPILKNTYGIMVYQEQIMQVAQKMGNYSLGGADLLRRAMGKKKMDVMQKERVNFANGASGLGVSEETSKEVFDLMEKFASYGFNKCLVGETEIIDAKTGEVVTIEDLYNGKKSVSTTISLDTTSLKLCNQPIKHVMFNGIKPVYELTTAAGKKIQATDNHPFYTFSGWKNLGDLQVDGLIATRNNVNINSPNNPSEITPVLALVTPGIQPNESNNLYSSFSQQIDLVNPANLGNPVPDIFWDKIVSIEYIGKKPTYDLEIAETHNFVANDIIVHNSHAAAYSVLAFKTAYMKAHFPPEYMASVLTHNVNDIKKITFFIEECRRMGIKVLPPSINESQKLFSVNAEQQIRFGMSAIKGVGSAAVEEIIKERKENGPFESLFDLTTRITPQSLNRKTLESLAYAGAFDEFGVKRYQYFMPANGKDDQSVLDRSLSYGRKVQAEKNSKQISLFGGDSGFGSGGLEEPTIPVGTMRDGKVVEAWSRLMELNFEKDVIGFYLSGHPLERYKWQIESFATPIAEIENYKDREVKIAGIVTSANERISKRGKKFMTFNIEDFTGGQDLALFGDTFIEFRNSIVPDEMVFITGQYQPRWNDPSEYELRLKEVKLMNEEFFDNMVQHIQLEIKNDELNQRFLDELKALLDANPGTYNLKFRIIDDTLGSAIDLVAAEARVGANGDLLAGLREMGVKVKLG